MVSNEIERLLSLHEAARRLGLAPRRLRRAVADGELPGYRPGLRVVYVNWPEVTRWVSSQQVPIRSRARGAEPMEEDAQR